MLSLQGAYEVISMWSKKYRQTCFILNSYLFSEFGKPIPKEKITQVTNKERLTRSGDTFIRSKITEKTTVGKKQPTVVVSPEKPKEVFKNSIELEGISVPKEAAEIIKALQNEKRSAKDYLLEAICGLIEVMYDPEDIERFYAMKDLCPLYQMARQRNLINALQHTSSNYSS